MQKYDEFKKIKLEATSLFKYKDDKALYYLHINNIYTLQDLFNLDCHSLKCSPVYMEQIKGLIYLAKFKYLKEDLPFIDIIDGFVANDTKRNVSYIETKTNKRSLVKCLIDMGFDPEFANRAHWSINRDCKFIEILRKTKLNFWGYSDEKNSVIEKISIIENWYQEKFVESYQYVSGKYKKFEDIKLGDTGLIRMNHLDLVYNCLRKNEIATLQELFTKDDLDMIQYNTTIGYAKLNLPINQTKGTIALLRNKYLKEDLPFIEILNNKIHEGYFMVEGKSEVDALIENLTYLGLPYEFCFSLDKRAKEYERCGYTGKLVDFLENYYVNRIGRMYCNRKEYDNAISKLEIILDWYRSLDPEYKQIDTEEEARSKLLELYQKLNDLKIKGKEISEEIAKTEKDISYTDAVLSRIRKK